MTDTNRSGTELVPWWRTDLGEDEIHSVANAIRNRHINQGPVCRELEARIAETLEVPHVVLTTSGSAALALANMSCGIEPGDEVLVPAITYIATAHASRLLGATVRLVDVCPDKPLIDPSKLEESITERTKAIVAVHLNGQSCNLRAIREVAEKHDLRVIEDSAQAFASKNSNGWLGTQADVGTFSMSIAKLITTGEGGFAASNDPEMAERLHKLRNQGVNVVADNVFDDFGFNLRFNDMLAAVGIAQMDRLEEKAESVKRVYEFYRNEVHGLHYLKLLKVDIEGGELPLWTQVLCAEREKVISLLGDRNIQARPFHPCLNASPQLGDSRSFPVAESFAKLGLTLPSGPDQTQDNLKRTVAALHEIASEIETTIDSVESPLVIG